MPFYAVLCHAAKKRKAPDLGRRFLVLVEARRIELRSILDPWSGSTSLVAVLISGQLGTATRVAGPSRFDLSLRHTGYVRKSISLK